MTDEERIVAIEVAQDIADLGTTLYLLERLARRHPNGFLSGFMGLAGTIDFGGRPTGEMQAAHAAREFIDGKTRALLEGGTVDHAPAVQIAPEYPQPRKAHNRTADSQRGKDSRTMEDWRNELVSYAMAHGGSFDGKEYRQQKFLVDYPNLKTSQTRYAMSLNDATSNRKLFKRTGTGKYELTEKGKSYAALAAGLIQGGASKAAPGQRKRGGRRRDSIPVAERMEALARQNNGIFTNAAFKQSEKSAGRTPVGGRVYQILKRRDTWQDIGDGQYRLKAKALAAKA